MPGTFDFIGQVLGRVAQSVTTGNPVYDELVRGFARYSEHASAQWISVGLAGIRCKTHYRPPNAQHVEECKTPAIAACISCGEPCCINHAYVNVTGEVVCGTCIHTKLLGGKAAPHPHPGQQQAAPPPPTEDRVALRKQHMKTLGLRGRITEKVVNSAYRKRAAKWHPDRYPESEKAEAQRRFVELGQAKDWLLKDLEQN